MASPTARFGNITHLKLPLLGYNSGAPIHRSFAFLERFTAVEHLILDVCSIKQLPVPPLPQWPGLPKLRKLSLSLDVPLSAPLGEGWRELLESIEELTVDWGGVAGRSEIWRAGFDYALADDLPRLKLLRLNCPISFAGAQCRFAGTLKIEAKQDELPRHLPNLAMGAPADLPIPRLHISTLVLRGTGDTPYDLALLQRHDIDRVYFDGFQLTNVPSVITAPKLPLVFFRFGKGPPTDVAGLPESALVNTWNEANPQPPSPARIKAHLEAKTLTVEWNALDPLYKQLTNLEEMRIRVLANARSSMHSQYRTTPPLLDILDVGDRLPLPPTLRRLVLEADPPNYQHPARKMSGVRQPPALEELTLIGFPNLETKTFAEIARWPRLKKLIVVGTTLSTNARKALGTAIEIEERPRPVTKSATLDSLDALAQVHLERFDAAKVTAVRRERLAIRRSLGHDAGNVTEDLNGFAWDIARILRGQAFLGPADGDDQLLTDGLAAARKAVALEPAPHVVDTLAALLGIAAKARVDVALEDEALALRRRICTEAPSQVGYHVELGALLLQVAARRGGDEGEVLTAEANGLDTD